jgi:RHS repeat-associated protein
MKEGCIRITNSRDGEVVSAQDYFAYGEVIPERNYNAGDVNDRFKFTEKERDKESAVGSIPGYDYFGARYYDSERGRWLDVDPLADKYPGWSPYNYTLNNPIKNIDPDGKYTKASIDGHYFFHRYSTGEAKLITYGQLSFLESWTTNDPSFYPTISTGDWIGQKSIDKLFNSKVWTGITTFFGTAESKLIWDNSEKNFIADQFVFELALSINKEGIQAVLPEQIGELKNGVVVSLKESDGTTLRLNPEYVKKFYGGDYSAAFNDIDKTMKLEKSIRLMTDNKMGIKGYHEFVHEK